MTSDAVRAIRIGGINQRTWALLNEIGALFGTTKQAMWPFFENTGQVISGLGAATDLVPRDEVGAKNLEDEWTPRVARSGITYVVKNIIASNHNFSAGDNAAYSFTDGSNTDDPLTMAIWVAPASFATAQSLFAKYDGAAEEYDFRIDTSGKLVMELHDAGASATEIATAATALILNQMQLVTMTYDGAQGAPAIKFYIDGVLAGEADSVESGTYLGMENTVTPLLIAARDLTASPEQEFGGWFTLPMMGAKELTAAEVKTLHEMSREIVGT